MDLIGRALAAGLRSVALEIEAGNLTAAEVLAHLGPPALAPAAPPAAPPSKRRRRRRSRPAAAEEPEPEAEEHEPEAAAEAASRANEAAELVAKLAARAGGLNAAAARFGFAPASMHRWADGLPASPGSLSRLRGALGPGARAEPAAPG